MEDAEKAKWCIISLIVFSILIIITVVIGN